MSVQVYDYGFNLSVQNTCMQTYSAFSSPVLFHNLCQFSTLTRSQ